MIVDNLCGFLLFLCFVSTILKYESWFFRFRGVFWLAWFRRLRFIIRLVYFEKISRILKLEVEGGDLAFFVFIVFKYVLMSGF